MGTNSDSRRFFDRLAIGLAALLFALVPVAPTTAQDLDAQRWQCAPFARVISGIQLFGNASAWWSQAAGRYERGQTPQPGAALVFRPSRSMQVGHVAVVNEVVSDRVIRVTHANWSPINGRRGRIEREVEMVDVSANNDWSRVRVWYAPIQSVGTGSHATFGFVYADDAARQIARLDNREAPVVLAHAEPVVPAMIGAAD